MYKSTQNGVRGGDATLDKLVWLEAVRKPQVDAAENIVQHSSDFLIASDLHQVLGWFGLKLRLPARGLSSMRGQTTHNRTGRD